VASPHGSGRHGRHTTRREPGRRHRPFCVSGADLRLRQEPRANGQAFV